jgi:hypothetical protein
MFNARNMGSKKSKEDNNTEGSIILPTNENG